VKWVHVAGFCEQGNEHSTGGQIYSTAERLSASQALCSMVLTTARPYLALRFPYLILTSRIYGLATRNSNFGPPPYCLALVAPIGTLYSP
jgi:hypothetical protein